MSGLEPILKAARRRALATLIRVLGDFDAAEDALQEAMARALAAWPKRGLPDNPVAWLVRTGRNYAVDGIRRRATESRHAALAAPLAEAAAAGDPAEAAYDDDLLRLIFTCCHPALPQAAQVALTLKTVAGLSVDEIAAAFLVQPKTMEQRLTRAKRKIRDAGIPYRIPDAAERPARLAAVLAVIYLVFNEGYRASQGPELIRAELCQLAVRLGRFAVRLFAHDPETAGLLALMLLTHARAPARLDGAGTSVPLEDQDRGLWDQAMLREGRALVEKALLRKRPGPYQIQAAIAAVHGRALAAGDTDWAEIAALYAALERHRPSAVVTINRAVAIARAEGPAAGLALLENLADLPEIAGYQPFHAARAGLLEETGDAAGARDALARALALTDIPAEQTYLRRKLARLK